jgi:DNA replication protein DnaC
MTTTTLPDDENETTQRLKKLGLWGLLAHRKEFGKAPWLERLLQCEEEVRAERSLERRISTSRIGSFRPMADFDWAWPKTADRSHIEELFSYGFVQEGANVILIGPNGVGKTMIAKNLGHQALVEGHTVRYSTASAMLNDLARQDSGRNLESRLKKYVAPSLMIIDEVGYLSYNARYADLLYEVTTRRYEARKSTVITTNKPFSEWGEVFPNASCVVTLVDRLCHRAEVIPLDGESYRRKEAQERAAKRKKARRRAPRR